MSGCDYCGTEFDPGTSGDAEHCSDCVEVTLMGERELRAEVLDLRAEVRSLRRSTRR